MNTKVFDGKTSATNKIMELKSQVEGLDKNKKLVSIVAGNSQNNLGYATKKQDRARELGLLVEVKDLGEEASFDQISVLIEELNVDTSVAGIMLQLPLNDKIRSRTDELIAKITPDKDVDGMREDSKFIAPVVRSILFVLEDAEATNTQKVTILGAKGFVGVKTEKELKKAGYTVIGIDKETTDISLVTKNADILITTCGQPGIITGDMIKEGVTIIDVSAPLGDVQTESVMGRAKYISPVPGGVGPMTIYFLMENLVDAVSSSC